MPERVWVGGLIFDVKLWPVKEADDAGAWGICERDQMVIRVMEGLHIQQEARVLLHEVMHGAFMTGGMRELDVRKGAEERIVDIMSFQMVAIMRHNPGLMAYLQEALR